MLESAAALVESAGNMDVQAQIDDQQGPDLLDRTPVSVMIDGERLFVYEFTESPEGTNVLDAITQGLAPDPHLKAWVGEKLVVTYSGENATVTEVMQSLLGEPISQPAFDVDEPFPPAVPGAMRSLAEAQGRAPQEVVVLGYQTVIWPDACLGIPQPGEICAQVETPGWLIQVSLDEKVYALHSDEAGVVVTWNEPPSDP